MFKTDSNSYCRTNTMQIFYQYIHATVLNIQIGFNFIRKIYVFNIYKKSLLIFYALRFQQNFLNNFT